MWTLHRQADALLADIRAETASPAVGASTASQQPLTPRSAPVGAQRASSLSGQQLLLGLGGLLLLSAAAFFLWATWSILGTTGQVVVLLTLTALAYVGSRWAAGRGLASTTETMAVLAVGMLLIDAWGAHRLDFAGLGDVSTSGFWTAALTVIGSSALLAHRVRGAGQPQTLGYLISGWGALALAVVAANEIWSPTAPLARVALAIGSAALAVGVAAAAYRWHRTGHQVHLWLPTLVAGRFLLASVAVPFEVGASGVNSVVERYVSAVVLFALAALILLAARRLPLSGSSAALVATAAIVPGLAGLLVLFLDADIYWIAALAPVVTVSGGMAARLLSASAREPVTAVVTVALALLSGTALVLQELGTMSLREVLDDAAPSESAPLLVTLVPSACWLATSIIAWIRNRRLPWFIALVLAGSVLVAQWLVRYDDEYGWALGGLAVAVITLGWLTWSTRSPRPAWVRETEPVAALVAAGWAVVASLAAADLASTNPYLTPIVAAVLAAGVLGWAANPARLPLAYLATALLADANRALLDINEVTVIEAFSLPVAVVLTAIGVVQWRRDASTPSLVTMGPALGVVFGPTLWVALRDGDMLRLGIITLLAVGALGFGLATRTKAAVTVGAATLVVVAITQGGPYAAYLPGWVLIGLTGALLLAAGTMWERALTAGRATGRWYADLA